MKIQSHKITPALLVLFALTQASSVMAGNDETLFKACPDLKAWAAVHPHHGDDAAAATAVTQGAITSPAIRAELKERVAADQRVRDVVFSGGKPDKKSLKKLAAVDQDNHEWLKQTIAEHGFPTTEQVGKDGVSDAFLLLQHADNHPEFQETTLESLLPRLATAGVPRSAFAKLTDRVLVSRAKLQRYGTQFSRSKDGTFTLEPTQDMAHLAERRKQMDLMPLPTYECVLRASYASQ